LERLLAENLIAEKSQQFKTVIGYHATFFPETITTHTNPLPLFFCNQFFCLQIVSEKVKEEYWL
jgi:hypothetical protein